MTTQLDGSDREWLQQLLAETSKLSEPDKFGRRHRFDERPLTEEEWLRLKQLIEDHELPCWMYAGPYGFGVSVFDHGHIKGECPEMLFTFEYHQVPGTERGFQNQPEAAEKLSEITHTDRNKQLLDWYGMGSLKEPQHYVY